MDKALTSNLSRNTQHNVSDAMGHARLLVLEYMMTGLGVRTEESTLKKDKDKSYCDMIQNAKGYLSSGDVVTFSAGFSSGVTGYISIMTESIPAIFFQ